MPTSPALDQVTRYSRHVNGISCSDARPEATVVELI